MIAQGAPGRREEKEDIVKKANALAESAFAKQGLQGKKRMERAARTAKSLLEMGFDSTTVASAIACALHTKAGLSEEEISEKLGGEIAEIAADYGKIRLIEEKNLGKISNEMLSTIILATARDLRAIFVKLVARLDALQNTGPGAKGMEGRAQSALQIYAPICQKMGLYDLQSALEDSSLMILKPETHRKIKTLLGKTREERELEVERAIEEVSRHLKGAPAATISGRAKSIYSTYRKMDKQGKEFGEICDLLGIRMVCDSVRECYELLGIIHSEYKTVPNQFTDYIANPKKNGYRSIHTVVLWEGKPLEIQIRTWEMHYECETGLAAHWHYKNYASDRFFDKKLSLIKQLVEWHRSARNSENLAHSLKMGFGQKQIFVFTPKQQVEVLPEGASPIDFAFAIHSDLGMKCQRAKVNGKIVQLSHKLENGDNVEIITGKENAVKRQWLSLAKSHKAQSKIRQKLGIKPGKKGLVESKGEALTSGENIRIARCCGPVPGDEIIGVKTTKRKISVHRASCVNLKSIGQGRKVKIGWDLADKDYIVGIKVRAKDSPGLLPAILKILEKSRVAITATDAKTSKNNLLQCKFNIKIKNIGQLEGITQKIGSLPTVLEVERE
jgi:GTP pyrophosphokinase